MRMKMHRPAAFKHLDQRVHAEVPVRWLNLLTFTARSLFIAICLPLSLVVARFDELLALQRGESHASARRLAPGPVRSLRVLTVGHLQAPFDTARGDHHLLERATTQLDVKRVATDRVATAWHDV